MTHPSKVKGNAFERELVQAGLASGIPSKRAYASNGEALGQVAGVDVMIGTKRIQAKRRAKIATWLKTEQGVDAVAVREDRGEVFIVLRLDEYLLLIAK